MLILASMNGFIKFTADNKCMSIYRGDNKTYEYLQSTDLELGLTEWAHRIKINIRKECMKEKNQFEIYLNSNSPAKI